MNREQFSVRFQNAIDLVISNTKMLCFNTLSGEYKFMVSSNNSTSPVMLDETEAAHLKKIKDLANKPLLFEEAIDVISVGDRHPLWINISVYEAASDFTFIEMVCSKRLRNVESTPNIVDKFPPFHVWVPAPTREQRVKLHNKFDVNWRSMADKNKNKGLLNKIRNYFSGD